MPEVSYAQDFGHHWILFWQGLYSGLYTVQYEYCMR